MNRKRVTPELWGGSWGRGRGHGGEEEVMGEGREVEHEGFHTWFVLNTNFVPLVRLSVTIIKLLSEGLHRIAMVTTLVYTHKHTPVVHNASVFICDQRLLLSSWEDMNATFIHS